MNKEEVDVSYEDYIKATNFAKFRYKYGFFVIIASWMCILLLMFFVIYYGEELSSNPGQYTLKFLNVNECYCYGEDKDYYFNSSQISWKGSVNRFTTFDRTTN